MSGHLHYCNVYIMSNRSYERKMFRKPVPKWVRGGARRTVTRVENVVWGHSSTSSSAADAKQTRLNTYDIHMNHEYHHMDYDDIHIMGILFNRPWLWSSAILIRFHKTKFRQKCTICSKHVFNMSIEQDCLACKCHFKSQKRRNCRGKCY